MSHLLSWRLTEEEESRWAWRSALSWGRGTVMLNLAWCVDILDIVDTVYCVDIIDNVDIQAPGGGGGGPPRRRGPRS